MLSKELLRKRMTIIKRIGRSGSLKELYHVIDRLIIARCVAFDGNVFYSFNFPDQKEDLLTFLRKSIGKKGELLIDLSPAAVCVSMKQGNRIVIYADGY